MDWTRRAFLLIVVLANLVAAPEAAHAQTSRSRGQEHWVATWATAQALMPTPGLPRPARPPGAPPRPPAGSAAETKGGEARPAQPGRGRSVAASLPASFADQTVRMVVRASVGGKRVRVELSNMLTAQPLEIGSAHVAIHTGRGAIASNTDRSLTFGSRSSITIPPGMLAISDSVDLHVAPLAELAVSLYLPRDTGTPTSHTLGLHTAYISKGNTAGAAGMPDDAAKMYSYVWLSSVDVATASDAFTVVALGDSITDGQATTLDADRAWPAQLAKRLQSDKSTKHVAVVNQGIAGNQVLRDGMGVSALTRFDRDVLSRPGVKWVIMLEGINDINLRGNAEAVDALSAEDLIWGYKQIIARAHMHGIKVIGATVMPEEGVWIATERTEEIRQAVNRWIRAAGNFDAVVDFDAAVRDAQRPSRLRAEFDPGDRIHPNDAGNQAMADAFNLTVFKR